MPCVQGSGAPMLDVSLGSTGPYRVLGAERGGELVDGERGAHLWAFPVRRDERGGGSPIELAPVAPLSRRRRNR
jgi:hypothetical protein